MLRRASDRDRLDSASRPSSDSTARPDDPIGRTGDPVLDDRLNPHQVQVAGQELAAEGSSRRLGRLGRPDTKAPDLVGADPVDAVEPQGQPPVQSRRPRGLDEPAEPTHHDPARRDGPCASRSPRRPGPAGQNQHGNGSSRLMGSALPARTGGAEARPAGSWSASGPDSSAGPRLSSLSSGLDDDRTTVVLGSRIDP